MSTYRPQFDEVYGHSERALAPVWQDAVILVITEFGRTVEVNGRLGPASGHAGHGIATTAFVTGGASRVAA